MPSLSSQNNSQEVNLYDMLDGGTPHSGPPAGMRALLSQQRAQHAVQHAAAKRASGSADLAALVAHIGGSGQGGDGALADAVLSTLRSFDQRMAEQAEVCFLPTRVLPLPGRRPGCTLTATASPRS